jgi:hypothetical protein
MRKYRRKFWRGCLYVSVDTIKKMDKLLKRHDDIVIVVIRPKEIRFSCLKAFCFLSLLYSRLPTTLSLSVL